MSFGAVLAELDGGSAMAAIRCRIFRHAELSGPLGHRRVSLTPNHAELVMNPCFHTVLCGRPRGAKVFFQAPFLCLAEARRFFVPGLRLHKRRAQPLSSMAAGHRWRRREACLTAASTTPSSDRSEAAEPLKIAAAGSASVVVCLGPIEAQNRCQLHLRFINLIRRCLFLKHSLC